MGKKLWLTLKGVFPYIVINGICVLVAKFTDFEKVGTVLIAGLSNTLAIAYEKYTKLSNEPQRDSPPASRPRTVARVASTHGESVIPVILKVGGIVGSVLLLLVLAFVVYMRIMLGR